MSRSYKKTPYSGNKKNKYLKNYANHRIRQYEGEIPNGKSIVDFSIVGKFVIIMI